MTGLTQPAADQAAPLRAMVQERQAGLAAGVATPAPGLQQARVVTVTSGKGGVGKTVLAVNLALAMGELGLRVGLVDADLGMANVAVLLGAMPRYHVGHVVRGICSLEQALWQGPQGLLVLPGASGMADLAALEGEALQRLLGELRRLDRLVDVVVVDTGAGIGPQVMAFLQASPEVLVVSTPEPTAITNAYGLVKALVQGRPAGSYAPLPRLFLTVNMERGADEGQRVMRRLETVTRRFLGVEVVTLGVVPYDTEVPRAVVEQTPLLVRRPGSPAARAIRQVAHRLLDLPAAPQSRGLSAVVRRMLRLMR